MVCGVDDLLVCMAVSCLMGKALSNGVAHCIRRGSDWVVDEAFVGAFEECYRNAKGNFDRRKEEEAMVHYQEVYQSLQDRKGLRVRHAEALSEGSQRRTN